MVNSFDYTACYCEENIWRLCTRSQAGGRAQKVVWISSLSGVCPLWHQRASTTADQPVWWDYHVILLVLSDRWRVWDLDTRLALPEAAGDYLLSTFHNTGQIEPLFRVMDADYYLRFFSSDRSHMKDEHAEWLASPPEWDLILPDEPTFYEMRDFSSSLHGELLTLPQMHSFVSENDSPSR